MGTTEIELTNVRTGEVEKYRNHNMVTNALRDIFSPLGLSNSPDRYFNQFAPYYQTLLGGILCFDMPLTENPDEYFPPAEANVIGCAAYGEQNNTANTLRGGFNHNESEINLKDRYVKYVYDFATSQANGTISSVCLTHKKGGLTSYGGKSTVCNSDYNLMQGIAENTLQYVHPDYTGADTSSRYSGYKMGVTEMIFLIDHKNDCALYFKVVDKNHIHITKRKTFLRSVSILENVRTTKPLIEEIEIKELENPLILGRLGYNYDPETDCLYICTTSNGSVEPNETVLVTEIKIDKWTVKQYSVTNTTGVSLRSDNHWQFFVTKGFLFLKQYDEPHNLYKIQLDNPANVIEFTRINCKNIDAVPKAVINGRIYFENECYQLLIANTYTNEIMPPEARSLFNNGYQLNVTPVRNEPLLYFTDLGNWNTSGWNMICNYLATINNLDTPVTKTADKTMKITYILQEQ